MSFTYSLDDKALVGKSMDLPESTRKYRKGW